MPALDLNALKASVLSNGLLRSNLFRIRIFPPPAIAQGINIGPMLADLEMWGEAASVPDLTLGTTDQRRWGYGAIEKRPYMPVYSPWSVTFRVDNGGLIWRFFKNWANRVINITSPMVAEGAPPGAPGAVPGASKYEIAYKNTYLADMEVSVFTETGMPVINATLIEAFPYMLEPIHLDWAPSNEYLRFRVDFTFTDWVETNSTDEAILTFIG